MEVPARSNEIALESFQFHEEIRQLMAPPPENASSFTALLELPHSRAVELLHSPERSNSQAVASEGPPKPYFHCPGGGGFGFPANSAVVGRDSMCSSFTVEANGSSQKVKDEPVGESDSDPHSSSQPLVSDPPVEDKAQKPGKRKDREKKAKGSAKKSKSNCAEDADKLPYVHVRARRGQATDSHSLAERARREKINARMKLLQELVPGCNKISGTALVLDEIINHVQSLQRQVEILSMRLAAVNPGIDFNLDSIFAAESASLVDSNFSNVSFPLPWSELQANMLRQQYQQQPWHLDSLQHPMWGREDCSHNLIASENSHLSYDSPANSVSMHSRAAENGVTKVE
ncbi:transcription factor bHLH48-like isoform X2 [Punica granatum]|uniref:Uncharacterized protein n=2 Tax=Punica granatum TaxID=22663 RepID=A0A2I0KUN3_PUNGR|nr:transcription factor bHLH48-like isoform X2 [Punica granatum]PKI72189.1 hypothetical protein CRG98_007387 [Punica granatum]